MKNGITILYTFYSFLCDALKDHIHVLDEWKDTRRERWGPLLCFMALWVEENKEEIQVGP